MKFIIFVVLLSMGMCFGEEESVEMKAVYQQHSVYQQPLLESISLIKYYLEKAKYFDVLTELERLQLGVVSHIGDRFKMVFPQRYLGYELQVADGLGDDPFMSDNLVNLFNLTYQHPSNGMITMSLLRGDLSSQEYRLLMKDEQYLNKLGNAKLVFLRARFPAIFKLEPEQRYAEYNILINDMISLNVVAIDVEDNELLHRFVQFINFDAMQMFFDEGVSK